MPDGLDDYLDPPKPRGPRERVHSIASRSGISPDIADDYLKLTRIESGHNVNVRDSSKGAQGFGQVMPDRPGGTTRTVGGRKYNLRNPDENIEAGIRYFAEGGSDPVARRLYYFGGPKARQTYQRTGRIPNISDGNMTAEQYVRATGAMQSQKSRPVKSDLDNYLDAPPKSELDDYLDKPETTSEPTRPPARKPPPRLTYSGTGRAFDFQRPKPTLEVGAKVGGPRPSTGIADLRRIDDREVSRINRIRQQVEAEQTEGERALRRAPGTAQARLFDPKLNIDEEVLRRVSEEQAREQAQADAEVERKRLLSQFTDAERAEIADFTNHLKGKGRVYTGLRTGLRSGGSRTAYKLAGLADLINKAQQPLTGESSWIPDYLRKKALAGEMSVDDIPQEKRNQLAEFLAETGVGLAELGATPGGITTKFASLAGTEAVGRNRSAKEVAQETAKGAMMGAVQKYGEGLAPQGAGRLRRAATSVPAVGLGSGAVELATGATPREAALSAVTNAAFQGMGEVSRGGRRARTSEARPETVADVEAVKPQPEKVNEPQVKTQSNVTAQPEAIESIQASTPRVSESVRLQDQGAIVSEAQRAVSGIERGAADTGDVQAVQGDVASTAIDGEPVGNQPAVVAPRKWQHADFGEVTESPNQRRVDKKRVRVIAEDGSEHVIKRSNLRGAGNQKAVPLKPENVGAVTGEQQNLQQPMTAPTPKTGPLDESVLDRVQSYSGNTPAEIEALKKSPYKTAILRDIGTGAEPINPESPTDGVRFRTANGDIVKLRMSYKEDATYGDRTGGFIVEREVSAPKEQPVTAPESVTETITKKTQPPMERAVTEEGGVPDGSMDTPSEPSTTSARKAQFAADRAELDLPELPAAERKSWQRSLSEAKPQEANILADEVLRRPRPLNDAETASLVVRAQEIKNRHAEVMNEIGAAKDAEIIQQKRAELSALESEFDKLTDATKKSGTEKGRALAAQKLTINQDFDLVSMKNRVKAAKGAELTEKENVKIEDLHSRLAKAEAERDAAIERATQAESNKAIERMVNKVKRERSRTVSRKALDDEFADLRAQFAQARAEARNVQASGLAGIDPEGKLAKIVIKMTHNRVKAGTVEVNALVSEIYNSVKEFGEDITERDIRDTISGYSITPKSKRSELQKQLASVRTELRKLSRQEDIDAGILSSRQEGPKRDFTKDQTRFRQLQKQEAELTRRIAEQDFSQPDRSLQRYYTRETYAKERAVRELKAEYEKMKYRATRSPAGKVMDTAVGAGNIPKTMLSMADLSAMLRQGGVGFMQHPVLSSRATKDMLTAFTRHGFANVENAIKNSPEFELAKKSGVEFTGVDIDDPRLTRREEGYLGSGAIDTLSRGRFNPLKVVKEVKDFSERTFVSFLDSQRMRIFEQQAQALRDMGLKGKELDSALKSQAKYINIITGRGSLGTEGNKLAPALNLAMFSPRLVASRFQLINKMFNPVAWARTPKGARELQMKDNLKFLVGTAAVLGLAKAAGADVTLDPDDSEFLKIKVGNTRYDTLTGLQQPMRFMLRMAKAIKGGETYAGDTKGDIAADFIRSKASPEVGLVADYLAGENRLTGKEFDATDIRDAMIPLPVQDFREAIKTDGALRGSIESLPSIFGIGTQTYKGAAEKPQTHAEKLARRMIQRKMPDEARSQAKIDRDAKVSDLRARSRRGEDVSADIKALGVQLTERQTKNILDARNKTRLQEDFSRLGLKEAVIVYSVANQQQREQLKTLLQEKTRLLNTMLPEQRADIEQRLKQLELQPGVLPRQSRERPAERRPRGASREGYVFQ